MTRQCECGKTFEPRGPQRTCSKACARKRAGKAKRERDERDRREERALNVACSDCGAAVGVPCAGRAVHQARRLAQLGSAA